MENTAGGPPTMTTEGLEGSKANIECIAKAQWGTQWGLKTYRPAGLVGTL